MVTQVEPKPNQTKFLDAFIVLLGIIIFICGAYFWQGLRIYNFQRMDWIVNLEENSLAKPAGQLISKSEGVRIKKNNEINWRDIFSEQQLFFGDKIFTNDMGAAEITSNWGILQIEENSLVKLIDDRSFQAFGDGTKVILNQEKNVDLILPTGNKLNLQNTGDEQATVQISVNKNSETTIKVLTGKRIKVKTKERNVEITPNQKVKVSSINSNDLSDVEAIGFKIKSPTFGQRIEMNISESTFLPVIIDNNSNKEISTQILLRNMTSDKFDFKQDVELIPGENKFKFDLTQTISKINQGTMFLVVRMRDNLEEKESIRFYLSLLHQKATRLKPFEFKFISPISHEERILFSDDSDKNLKVFYQLDENTGPYTISLQKNDRSIYEKQFQDTVKGQYQFEIPIDFSNEDFFGKTSIIASNTSVSKNVPFYLVNGDALKNFPNDNAKIEITRPKNRLTFQWEETSLPGTYLFELSKDKQFTKITKAIKTAQNKIIIEINALGHYYWRVHKLIQNKPTLYTKPREIILTPGPLPNTPNIDNKVLKLVPKKNNKIKKSVFYKLFNLIFPSVHAAENDREKKDSVPTPELMALIDWQVEGDVKSTILEIFDKTGQKQILKVEVFKNFYEWHDPIPGEYLWQITFTDHWGRPGKKSDKAKLTIHPIEAPIKIEQKIIAPPKPLSVKNRAFARYTPHSYNYEAKATSGKVTVDGQVIESLDLGYDYFARKFMATTIVQFSRGVIFKGKSNQSAFNNYSLGPEVYYKLNSNPAWYLLTGLKLNYESLLDFDIPTLTNSNPRAMPTAKSISLFSIGPVFSFIFGIGDTLIRPKFFYQLMGAKGPGVELQIEFKRKFDVALFMAQKDYTGAQSKISSQFFGIKFGIPF